ncbi:hypothetical protein PHISCL_01388 [Aspergillus sclerotialis]|uniref:HNH nuclease domain-containing protein n=1 Tax=Aspergillus sclerotialis TaxID=2070753 RepID=A0A3A2ZT44_9EURO|nr:hypothetical protein PHISCL_01388 [Aspergillus sclerotialis]
MSVLKTFWSEQKIKAWMHEVVGARGTEILANRIAMALNVHRYWGKAMFAIKPIEISKDGKTLYAEFYWLPTDKPGSRSMLSPSKISNNMDSTGDHVSLWNIITDRRLHSGEQIVFHTDDPEAKPLPSSELLKMQWVLHRVAALSGAAEYEDDYDTDDGDGGNGGRNEF